MHPTHQETMPRFNRLRPVKSYKHVFDLQGALAAGTQLNTVVIDAVDAPTLSNTIGVEVASTVNSIYLKVEAYATSAGALSNLYMIVMKNPSNAIATPAANTVGGSDVKKYILHQEMVMLQQVDKGNPRTLFVGVIRIPRGYRRFGQDDALIIGLLSPGVTVSFCMQVIYKEFR